VDFPWPSNDTTSFRQFIARCVLTQSEVRKTSCQNTTIYLVQLIYKSPLNMVIIMPATRQRRQIYTRLYWDWDLNAWCI